MKQCTVKIKGEVTLTQYDVIEKYVDDMILRGYKFEINELEVVPNGYKINYQLKLQ